MAEPTEPLSSFGAPGQRQVIGILGGLGPWAHLELERSILEAAARLLGLRSEQDYPSWLLSSMPSTPDRTKAIADPTAPDPVPFLAEGLRRLESGADFAVIPCNTAHRFLPRLRQLTALPILDMIGETARHVHRRWPEARVGILATTGTLEAGLYARALEDVGSRSATPWDLEGGERVQEEGVMAAIYGSADLQSPFAAGGIKLRGVFPEARRSFEGVAARLVRELGSGVIVAGCTEISLALEGEVAGVPVVDPMTLLAEAAVRRAYGLCDGEDDDGSR